MSQVDSFHILTFPKVRIVGFTSKYSLSQPLDSSQIREYDSTN